MSDTLKRLQTIVGQALGIEPEQIKPNPYFVKELGADQLDVVGLIIDIEYEFDILIEAQYASKIATVQDVLNSIEEKLCE
jgi:acyl carrier protein